MIVLTLEQTNSLLIMKNNIMDGMYCSARLVREAGIRTVQSIKRSWRRMKRGCMTIAYIWQ